ncbi:metallophosphoesterase [Pendulispora rubella]|uniref:Metallophosphoesterase n=1 Tax=Pendulispora rubella TaxID=2741070 RepID=A0ABZ2L0W3_9BACT
MNPASHPEMPSLRPRSAAYFEITHTVLPLHGLHPAHDGVRIAQLSDLHIGTATPRARVAGALEAVRRAQPDLVFLTGDFVTHSRYPLPRIAKELAGVAKPAFAVLGNHDHFVDARAVRTALEEIGCTVLVNESRSVLVRGEPLVLVGIDDAVTRHDDVRRAFEHAPAEKPALVLAHSPSTADDLPEARNLACFSGHTHGGHLHFGAMTQWIAGKLGQPYLRGLYEVRGNWLYVSRGLGFGRGSLVPRVASEPEVAFFELRMAT